MMAYIIQQVAVGAICVFAVAAVAFAAVEVVRLLLEDLRDDGGSEARREASARPARTLADCVEAR